MPLIGVFQGDHGPAGWEKGGGWAGGAGLGAPVCGGAGEGQMPGEHSGPQHFTPSVLHFSQCRGPGERPGGACPPCLQAHVHTVNFRSPTPALSLLLAPLLPRKLSPSGAKARVSPAQRAWRVGGGRRVAISTGGASVVHPAWPSTGGRGQFPPPSHTVLSS